MYCDRCQCWFGRTPCCSLKREARVCHLPQSFLPCPSLWQLLLMSSQALLWTSIGFRGVDLNYPFERSWNVAGTERSLAGIAVIAELSWGSSWTAPLTFQWCSRKRCPKDGENGSSALLAPPRWKFPSFLHPFYRLSESDSDHLRSTSGISRSVGSYELYQFGVEL